MPVRRRCRRLSATSLIRQAAKSRAGSDPSQKCSEALLLASTLVYRNEVGDLSMTMNRIRSTACAALALSLAILPVILVAAPQPLRAAAHPFAPQAAAQQEPPPDDQDPKDVKAYVLTDAKFQQITSGFADIAACRKQNRPAWDQLTSDPAYADATLTAKAKMMDAKVPQCTGLLKKQGMETHEYLVAIEALGQAESAVIMKKRNMTVPAAKAAASVNPATLAYVEAHTQEIDKWRQSIRAQAQAQQVPAQPQ
jgi:hypothetical protein